MIGGGIHEQPAGYWSDDSSMTLCLADSIPAEWVDALVNKELIDECIKGMEAYIDGL